MSWREEKSDHLSHFLLFGKELSKTEKSEHLSHSLLFGIEISRREKSKHLSHFLLFGIELLRGKLCSAISLLCSPQPYTNAKQGLMATAYFPVLIFLFMICLCQSDDRLTPAKPLLPGDVLISEGGVFAIGFFSLKNSTSSSYVGIWYNNIPERTYVWIANRDNPITTNMPGKLVFTNSSDLVLLDSTGHTIWTTRNNFTAGGGETAAVLLDSGNLVESFTCVPL